MVFKIQILGSGSALPVLHRNPSAQYINVLERHLLIDCGEGTQLQFQKFKIKANRIDHILISHLHGDHYLGLMGFLSSMHLLGRTEKLNLYAPPELQDIVYSQVKASKTYLNFDIHFVSLDKNESELIFEDNCIEIHTIPLQHRVYCNGFLIKEKTKPRRINKEKAQELQLPVAWMHRVIKGEDWQKEDGVVVKNEELTFAPHPSRSYAYCSDTCYSEKIVPIIQGVNLLYHEATFLDEMVSRAKKTFHSTATQAAKIAQQANVGKLLLGHFSARYREVTAFEIEAAQHFKDVIAVNDGDVFDVE